MAVENLPDPAPQIAVPDDAKLKELTQNMPQVVEDAILASEQKQQEEITQEKTILESLKDVKDKKGRGFDQNIHEYDKATGQPVLTPTGRFKRKLSIPSNISPQGGSAAPVIDPLRSEAEKWADMFIVGGMGFVGDEFKPVDGEREGLILSYYEIFKKYGIVAVHPIIGLVVAHGLYVGRRYEKPRTKGLLNAAFTSAKFFFINLWLKIQGKDYTTKPREDKKS